MKWTAMLLLDRRATAEGKRIVPASAIGDSACRKHHNFAESPHGNAVVSAARYRVESPVKPLFSRAGIDAAKPGDVVLIADGEVNRIDITPFLEILFD